MLDGGDIEKWIRSIVKEEIEREQLKHGNKAEVVHEADEWGGFDLARKRSGLSRPKIQELIDTGKVEAFQREFGSKWSINVSSLLRYLALEAKKRQKEASRRMA